MSSNITYTNKCNNKKDYYIKGSVKKYFILLRNLEMNVTGT